MKRLISALAPSGELTLGNYIGGISQFVKFQDDYETTIFVADLHAITVAQDPKQLRNNILKNVGLYIACGLDPNKVTLFIQSENIYHTNLSWVFECHAYMGELSRMTQFKDKSSKQESVTCGLFTYPVLMASDILLYDADIVPVGEDQKQHVELTRNIAERFNNKYGQTFVLPEPIIPKIGARIKNLQNPNNKMSKSDLADKGNIFLLDDLNVARKKIMSAVTDDIGKVQFDPQTQPGISNLIQIYASLSNKPITEVTDAFANASYGEFKKAVADKVVATLGDIQSKYNEVVASGDINQILDRGLEKTAKIAAAKYSEVCQKIGLGR